MTNEELAKKLFTAREQPLENNKLYKTFQKNHLPKMEDCPHRKLAPSLDESEPPKGAYCLNDVCFAIGEFFNLLDWAHVTEKQIDGMGKIMHRMDCACYNKILYGERDQQNPPA